MLTRIKQKAPKTKVNGVTISPMEADVALEVSLGIAKGPQYDLVLMFGLGGIFTEVYKDVEFCLLPVKEEELLRIISGIKGEPPLTGVRGQKPKDVKALVEMMINLAKMA